MESEEKKRTLFWVFELYPDAGWLHYQVYDSTANFRLRLRKTKKHLTPQLRLHRRGFPKSKSKMLIKFLVIKSKIAIKPGNKCRMIWLKLSVFVHSVLKVLKHRLIFLVSVFGFRVFRKLERFSKLNIPNANFWISNIEIY